MLAATVDTINGRPTIATATAANATSAAQKYMISTVRACEWPMRSNRWCRCCLSGDHGDLPARVRQIGRAHV